MAKELQGPLSGFRDMLAEQMIPRQQMINTIRKVYEGYGFTPLDTPAIERYETLTGKYGEEGEKLMYKFTDHGGRLLALRYDLTVPLARVVTQHRNEISLPYKRYQVGNVWRGESPQAGRYREFMQFDADTVGTKSAIADAEVVAMMADTMTALGADALVRVNNRLILDALSKKAGVTDEQETRKLIGTIDKVDKMGKDNVVTTIAELFGSTTAKLVSNYLSVEGSTAERLSGLEILLGNDPTVQEGVDNLLRVFSMLESSGYKQNRIKFDQTIARGLDYYTGIIYETTLKQLPKLGSVCSGGRFDNLVAVLGGPDLPAVGTSVGVDRLFTGLQQLGKLESAKTPSQVLITNFRDEDAGLYMKVATALRSSGIATEVYFEPGNVGKQIKFADKVGIEHVVFLGEEEMSRGIAKVKNMKTGAQIEISIDELPEAYKRGHFKGEIDRNLEV